MPYGWCVQVWHGWCVQTVCAKIVCMCRCVHCLCDVEVAARRLLGVDQALVLVRPHHHVHEPGQLRVLGEGEIMSLGKT